MEYDEVGYIGQILQPGLVYGEPVHERRFAACAKAVASRHLPVLPHGAQGVPQYEHEGRPLWCEPATFQQCRLPYASRGCVPVLEQARHDDVPGRFVDEDGPADIPVAPPLSIQLVTARGVGKRAGVGEVHVGVKGPVEPAARGWRVHGLDVLSWG